MPRLYHVQPTLHARANNMCGCVLQLDLAYNFTTNVHSRGHSVLWYAKLKDILHVEDGAVVKLWRFDPAKIMEKGKL